MIRPCTLPDYGYTEPFDVGRGMVEIEIVNTTFNKPAGYGKSELNNSGRKILLGESFVQVRVGQQLELEIRALGFEDAESISRHVCQSLNDALNASVLATEEVLRGLPMSADVYTLDEKTGDALKCTFDDEYGWRCRAGFLNEALELGKPYRIFTIKDPKTLEYFLQFYTDGTPVKGKETNND